jgi:hypothetical protein
VDLAVRDQADPADLEVRGRVALATRVAPADRVSRAARAVGMAAAGQEVTSPVVPAGTSPVAPEDTGPGARVDLEARGNLVGLASPVALAVMILADPAVMILAARGRMAQVLRGQGLRGRAAQVLNQGRALLDLTPTVPARAHLDRTPAVPDLMPAHLDRMCPAGRGPTRRRWAVTARAAATPREAQTRPADRTLRLAATPRAGATPPAEVTDSRP